MAPPGLSAPLALAVARRATTHEQGNTQIDPPDVPCQPALGAPRIHGELLKLRIKVSQSTVAKYMLRLPHSPSSTWRSFLHNHARGVAAIDVFIVPSATSGGYS